MQKIKIRQFQEMVLNKEISEVLENNKRQTMSKENGFYIIRTFETKIFETITGNKYAVESLTSELKLNEFQLRERMAYNGGIQEVEGDEYIYNPMNKKPCGDFLNALRERKATIKKWKANIRNLKQMALICPENPLNELLKEITKHGGIMPTKEERKQLIKKLSIGLYEELKKQGYISISYKQINSFLDNLPIATMKRLRVDILNVLKSEGFLKINPEWEILKLKDKYQHKQDKVYFTFELTELLSYDKFKRTNDGLKLIDCISNSNKSIYRKPHIDKQIVYFLI